MSGVGLPSDPANTAAGFAEDKGKGKSAAQDFHDDAAMDDDDDDDEDDDEDEDDEEDDEEENFDDENADDGNLEKIDLNNIVEGGRRTRGAKIDFAKAAEEHPAEGDEDEDDEEFQPTRDDTEMSG